MGRVLVIDDDYGVRDAFSMALEDTRYDVVSAEDGQTGLELARMYQPDLILLDLKMPGMNGVETLRELHKNCPGIPVYIVTAFYGEFLEPLRAIQDEGIPFDLARKPLALDEIRAIVDSVVGTTKAQA
ncbi:MAG: response regulator [Rhodospirillaceae bacterium]